MVQPQVESTIARMIDQQVSQRESGQVLNRFEQENQDWLYEADPRSSEGNFVAAINPVNNQRVPSQYGQAMANFFNQAKSSGVQDDQQALGMAKQMLASQISQQQAYSSNGELEHLRAEVAEMREKQEAAAKVDPKDASTGAGGSPASDGAAYNEKSFGKNALALAKEQGVI